MDMTADGGTALKHVAQVTEVLHDEDIVIRAVLIHRGMFRAPPHPGAVDADDRDVTEKQRVDQFRR